MFEDQCLYCGKLVQDDLQAYCSEDCQSQDTSESPSASSASSAISSPSIGYATGSDVPALLPSALGMALSNYSRSRHNRHNNSISSSTSSWSAVTDDEDEPYVAVASYNSKPFHESADSLYDSSPVFPSYLDTPIKSTSALSYARQPSGTNNRAMVNNPHRTHSHIRESVPPHPSTDDDGGYSDAGFSSRDESEPESYIPKPLPKSKRNRVNLPSYFSLLQVSGKRVSPVSSSSGNTIVRPSPPTPRLPLAPTALSAVPRGRRRATDPSDASRSQCSDESISRSPSRSGRSPLEFNPSCSREADDEDMDWPSSPFRHGRGRAAVRRNSSPPPAMKLSYGAVETRETRGRFEVEVDVDAPGFGIGRSGLMHRDRARSGVAL